MKIRMSVALVLVSILLIAETAGLQQTGQQACSAPPQIDEVLGIKAVPGAFVMHVESGSAAQQAGLEVCDLIAGFNAHEFRKYGEPQAFVWSMREAAMFSGAELDVWKRSESQKTYRQSRLKISIPLQEDAKLGISTTFQLLVAAVIPGGPADAAGVQAGEFIDQVNGQRVSNLRSIIEVDQKIKDAAKADGTIVLILSQWEPIKNSATYGTGFTTREVRVRTQSR